jgi:hypothetical protein
VPLPQVAAAAFAAGPFFRSWRGRDGESSRAAGSLRDRDLPADPRLLAGRTEVRNERVATRWEAERHPLVLDTAPARPCWNLKPPDRLRPELASVPAVHRAASLPKLDLGVGAVPEPEPARSRRAVCDGDDPSNAVGASREPRDRGHPKPEWRTRRSSSGGAGLPTTAGQMVPQRRGRHRERDRARGEARSRDPDEPLHQSIGTSARGIQTSPETEWPSGRERRS